MLQNNLFKTFVPRLKSLLLGWGTLNMICPSFCCKKIGEDEIDNPDLGTRNQLLYIWIWEGHWHILNSITQQGHRGTVGLEDKMEELLDILIEGPPQLSVVAILIALGWAMWLLLQRLNAAVMWSIILIVTLRFQSLTAMMVMMTKY